MMVVARMRIRETVPVTSLMVITSPTRIGRSIRIIKPETKLANISCKPKPNPTLMAASSHWTFDQPRPTALQVNTVPKMVIIYRETVATA